MIILKSKIQETISIIEFKIFVLKWKIKIKLERDLLKKFALFCVFQGLAIARIMAKMQKYRPKPNGGIIIRPNYEDTK